MLTKLKKKIKRIVLILKGRSKHLKITARRKKAWYGNTYGGFYACPEFLNENSIVYSFGIGEDISFDRMLIGKHNCKVYGFDPTPKSIKWVSQQDLPSKFIFLKYGLGSKTGFVDFYLPRNVNHVSGSVAAHDNVNSDEKVTVKMKSIKDILSELKHKHIDVLKMDIEGAEYDVLENILDEGIPIGQILIEFHDRFFADGKLKSKIIIEKLNKHGYEIFAVSDSFEEISFINSNYKQID